MMMARRQMGASTSRVDDASTLADVLAQTVSKLASLRVSRVGQRLLMASAGAGLLKQAAAAPVPGSTTTLTVNGQTATVLFPTGMDYRRPIPLVIHFQGLDNGTAAPTTQWAPMANAAVAAGFIHATCAFHGNNYGNGDSMTDARLLFRAILDLFPVSGVIVSGESMGALGAQNCVLRGVIPDPLGMYLVQPVVNLRQRWEQGSRQADIRAAFGIASNGSDYATKTAGFDPGARAPFEYQGVPAYITASASDTVVPRATNADVLAASLATVGPVTTKSASGDHGDATHFVPADYVAFLKTVADIRDTYDFTTDSALVADFDAATLTGSNGSQVASWAPARGLESAALAQATASTRPTLVTASSINGKPAVSFANHILDTGDWSSRRNAPVTILMVLRVDPASSEGVIFTGRNGVYFYAGLNANPVGFSFGGGATAEIVKGVGGGGVRNFVIGVVFNGASSRHMVNTAAVTTGTTGTGSNAGMPGLRLGGTSAASTGNSTFQIARYALLSRALSDTELSSTVQSLASTYGVTLT